MLLAAVVAEAEAAGRIPAGAADEVVSERSTRSPSRATRCSVRAAAPAPTSSRTQTRSLANFECVLLATGMLHNLTD